MIPRAQIICANLSINLLEFNVFSVLSKICLNALFMLLDFFMIYGFVGKMQCKAPRCTNG